MADKIEQQNVEIGRWWWTGKWAEKIDYKKILKNKESLWDKDAEISWEEAEKLLKNFENDENNEIFNENTQTPLEETNKQQKKNTFAEQPQQIKDAIKKRSNNPTIQYGIAESYAAGEDEYNNMIKIPKKIRKWITWIFWWPSKKNIE